jgi:hypothetical protein
MVILCDIVIGVDCAIWMMTGLEVVALEVSEEAKVIAVVTPLSAFAAATASRSEQLALPLVLMFGSTQFPGVPLPLEGSVATVTTYAGAMNCAEPVSVPVAALPSVTVMGAVSAAVSVIETVIKLPLTLGVPKLAVPLVELKLAVAPLMALPLESFSVTVTVAELPATAGLGETTTVELLVDATTPVAVPLSETDCNTELTFRLLSVVTIEPPMLPTETGEKLIRSVQLAPEANEPALEDVVSCGQVELLPIVKPEAMLGLLPVPGVGKLRDVLPTLLSVSLYAPSVVSVVPTVVDVA